jgi:hypothetical protein
MRYMAYSRTMSREPLADAQRRSITATKTGLNTSPNSPIGSPATTTRPMDSFGTFEGRKLGLTWWGGYGVGAND